MDHEPNKLTTVEKANKVAYLLFVFGIFCNAQKANVTKWPQDLDFFYKTLEEKHIDLYDTISKPDFTS